VTEQKSYDFWHATLYRAAHEGLTNIQKHARASQASIRVQFNDRTASLTIRDDGRGFDPATLDQFKNKEHYGLAGVRERLFVKRHPGPGFSQSDPVGPPGNLPT
jgi:glucose-6-phosphate-specific signal transduction histidine kinase